MDTPGLVDGEMKYPFDVNNAIFEMSNLADLVLVFFDPIGQALTKRTLDVVETVHKKYPEKIRFFLSKVKKSKFMITLEYYPDSRPMKQERKVIANVS